VLEKMAEKQMPPVGSEQPSPKENEAVMAWIRAVRRYEANRKRRRPRPRLARRLSNAEYDYTIRDLTGKDLRPTREVPGRSRRTRKGFDNSGESLTLSAGLTKKYLQAAKTIAITWC
jgi:hypothetical protein